MPCISSEIARTGFRAISAFILIGSLGLIAPERARAEAPAVAAATLDFWEKSPKLWSEFSEKKKIFVSAKNVDERTQSLGAGLVKANVDQVWAFANDPEKIKTTTSLLENFKWDKATGKVELHLKLAGFRYLVKGIATPKPDPENPRIEFKVQEGDMVPFTADLELRSAKAQAARAGAPAFSEGQTLVRIFGQSAPDRSLAWPVRIALEAVLQRMAGTLREAVEKEVGSRP